MFPKFLCRFFPLTVSEENGLTEVEENDSEDTHGMTILTKLLFVIKVAFLEETHRRFYLGVGGAKAGGGKIIRRKGIMVYDHRYCVDKL